MCNLGKFEMRLTAKKDFIHLPMVAFIRYCYKWMKDFTKKSPHANS